MLSQENCWVSWEWSVEFEQLFREIVVKVILDTDMWNHFQMVSLFQSIEAENIEDIDILNILSLWLHWWDVGHCCKKTHIHVEWSTRVLEEFFLQGDEERLLDIPISLYCDRHEDPNSLFNSSQKGFLSFICLPLWQCILKI